MKGKKLPAARSEDGRALSDREEEEDDDEEEEEEAETAAQRRLVRAGGLGLVGWGSGGRWEDGCGKRGLAEPC